MWLLPVFSRISALALRTYYRLERAGPAVPNRGPVLLVANHPNSLLDPGLVAAVAGRPVRFLAKAPLFGDPQIGWLIRGAGAIPVYRRVDGEAGMERNAETFRAVRAALVEGAAVGIFPEGLSHDEPRLSELKTGAARIALGAAEALGGSFPIVPVGLSFRDKARLRSAALAVIGEPVGWADLAGRGEAPEAVRELTERVEEALRAVTVNLERWEDAPLVECVEAVYATEFATDPDPARRLARMRQVSESLTRLRSGRRDDWIPLAREVTRHARRLAVLGLRPDQLADNPSPRLALRWTLRHLAFFLLAAPLAALGALLFQPPFRLTALLERRARPAPDVRATYKLLVGALLHLLWVLGLASLATILAGTGAGLATLLAAPALGLLTLYVHDRWSTATAEARRFVLRHRRRATVAELRARQRELADRLEALRPTVDAR